VIPALLVGLLMAMVPGGLTVALYAAWLYTGSMLMAGQLLTHSAIRMTAKEWKAWCEPRRWALAGLGLPAWLLVWAHPLLGLATLDVFPVPCLQL